MKHKFVKHFSSITPLSAEEATAIEESMATKTFKKGDIIVREGQISMDTYFVLEGCIREYIITNGEEKTTNFFTEEQWVISLNSFKPNNRSEFFLACVEDTTVVFSNESEAQEMFKQFPRFETISRVVMEDYFTEQRKLLMAYVADSPEKRYLKLMESRPDLIQRVPQYQLASYIGIKPESLSRIRKRLTPK